MTSNKIVLVVAAVATALLVIPPAAVGLITDPLQVCTAAFYSFAGAVLGGIAVDALRGRKEATP